MFSDKRFIVYVYALKTSCLWTYKESEISQSDRSDFRMPQILDSVHLIWGLIFFGQTYGFRWNNSNLVADRRTQPNVTLDYFWYVDLQYAICMDQ